MNYKPTVLNDVFTLTHEAGHSMHTYYSTKSQPFQYYSYTIFVAEVASTFNEQLLAKYLIDRTSSKRRNAALINHEVDSIRATIVRQTMFAEFEKITHEMAESGEPLTVASMKSVYRGLLEAYFGPGFSIDEELSLECFAFPISTTRSTFTNMQPGCQQPSLCPGKYLTVATSSFKTTWL